jgi:hypothetical protein
LHLLQRSPVLVGRTVSVTDCALNAKGISQVTVASLVEGTRQSGSWLNGDQRPLPSELLSHGGAPPMLDKAALSALGRGGCGPSLPAPRPPGRKPTPAREPRAPDTSLRLTRGGHRHGDTRATARRASSVKSGHSPVQASSQGGGVLSPATTSASLALIGSCRGSLSRAFIGRLRASGSLEGCRLASQADDLVPRRGPLRGIPYIQFFQFLGLPLAGPVWTATILGSIRRVVHRHDPIVACAIRKPSLSCRYSARFAKRGPVGVWLPSSPQRPGCLEPPL